MENVGPWIEEMFGDKEIYFLQDEAPPHYHGVVRAYPNATHPKNGLEEEVALNFLHVPHNSHRWISFYGNISEIRFTPQNQWQSMIWKIKSKYYIVLKFQMKCLAMLLNPLLYAISFVWKMKEASLNICKHVEMRVNTILNDNK